MENRNQVIQNPVCHVFVKNALITIRLQIELQALQFHTDFVRTIEDGDCAKIGLTRLRTHGSKLGAYNLDGIIPVRILVVERLQNVPKLVTHTSPP